MDIVPTLDYSKFTLQTLDFHLKLKKINKRVVPNEQRVVGKIMAERIDVWTPQLGTPEYMDGT